MNYYHFLFFHKFYHSHKHFIFNVITRSRAHPMKILYNLSSYKVYIVMFLYIFWCNVYVVVKWAEKKKKRKRERKREMRFCDGAWDILRLTQSVLNNPRKLNFWNMCGEVNNTVENWRVVDYLTWERETDIHTLTRMKLLIHMLISRRCHCNLQSWLCLFSFSLRYLFFFFLYRRRSPQCEREDAGRMIPHSFLFAYVYTYMYTTHLLFHFVYSMSMYLCVCMCCYWAIVFTT